MSFYSNEEFYELNVSENIYDDSSSSQSGLYQVRAEETGDTLYVDSTNYDYDTKTYILKDNDASNSPILITDEWSTSGYSFNYSYDTSSNKVYAVEELVDGSG